MLSLGIRGILGVEPSSFDSRVRDALVKQKGVEQGKMMGRTVLENVFDKRTDLGNFTVVRLGRSDDGEGPGDSYLDIGEYPEDLEARFANTSSIKTIVPSDFSVLVDTLSVDGKEVPLNSAVHGVPAGRAAALLDTGTSEALVTKDVLDAIYSGIPGAFYSEALGLGWVVPCLAAPNVTFTIG